MISDLAQRVIPVLDYRGPCPAGLARSPNLTSRADVQFVDGNFAPMAEMRTFRLGTPRASVLNAATIKSANHPFGADQSSPLYDEALAVPITSVKLQKSFTIRASPDIQRAMNLHRFI
jgi:hypothetical protein